MSKTYLKCEGCGAYYPIFPVVNDNRGICPECLKITTITEDNLLRRLDTENNRRALYIAISGAILFLSIVGAIMWFVGGELGVQ